MMAASASATNVVNGNYYGNSSGADGGTETYSGSSGGGSSSSWSNSYNGSWGDSYSETLNSDPGFYSGYYTGYGTSYYGGGPGVSSGPGGGGGPGQVIAYADGAPEVSAYAEGFQTSAGGPGVPSPGNGGIFNAGAAVSASTYPATRAELEIPAGVGPSTNPSPGGANNFNGVTAQQVTPGTPAATPTESNAAPGARQQDERTPKEGETPSGNGPQKASPSPSDQKPGVGEPSLFDQEAERIYAQLEADGKQPITLLEALQDGKVTAEEILRIKLTQEEVKMILERTDLGYAQSLSARGFAAADERYPDLPPGERYVRFLATVNYKRARGALLIQGTRFAEYVDGIYKVLRASNPAHFAFETGMVIGGGKEPVLGYERSQLEAGVDMLLYLAILKGTNWGMAKLRGATIGAAGGAQAAEAAAIKFASGGKLTVFRGAQPGTQIMEWAVEEAAAGRSVLITSAGDVIPVGRISQLTGLSEEQVTQAVTHFRQAEHLLSQDGKLVQSAFERDPLDDALFEKLVRGDSLSAEESAYLSRLMVHESTEAAILQRLAPEIAAALNNGTMKQLLESELRNLAVPEETIARILADETMPISPFRVAHYIAHFSGAPNP
jgi:hypothetical protein